jgi:hypothetical protein
MFLRHGYDKLIYPLVAFGLLLGVCYRPVYRLRPSMPAGFFSEVSTGKTHTRSPAETIAWAYWESALMDIQFKHPHGHTLPEDPPAEFRVDTALGPAASDPVSRQLYWQRLRAVWSEPQIWTQQYEWDFAWASDPLTSGSEWLKDHMDRWFTTR